jgi:GT2 family glycosyltransferase
MTEVAVVILNFNGRNFLRQFLPSVIAYSASAKIIVADNASTDDSIAVLESEFSGLVEVVKIGSNLGFCGGYNYALRLIQAHYYVLLNSDVEVTSGWIDPIINILKKDPSIVAAQPKILSYHQKDCFEYAGAAGGFVDMLGYPFCRGRIFNHFEKDVGQYDDTRAVFWATGACLFIKAKHFHESGGLDEDFFAHMEEIDLCWRLNRSGHRIYYVGESKVYHVGGGTLSKSNPRKTFLNFRNGLSLLIKHLPFSDLWWKLPFRILLDWIAAVKFLLQGSPKDSWAVGKAHFNFLSGIGSDLTKRSKLNSIGYRVTNQYPRLLTFEFFLLGKKTFRDLGKF